MDHFVTHGYYGPIPVLTDRERRRIYEVRRKTDYPLIPDWSKALAVHVPSIYRIAAQPSVLNTVKAIIGNDVLLWGASFVTSKPGYRHPWHNDIESSVADGKSVSVWIGIKHTSPETGLQLISRSHTFRQSIQQVRYDNHIARGQATVDMVRAWAQKRDAQCALVIPEISDGDAFFFDGWIWHATQNASGKYRTALLLQFATPDTRIRIPDPNSYDWPFNTLSYPKPPCIMVSGTDRFGVNRIVPAPVTHDGVVQQVLSTCINHLSISLLTEADKPWKPHHLFRGSTPNLQGLTCHASTLDPGHTPHPPHHHREDEILILLSGTAHVTLPDLANMDLDIQVPMKPGDFVFYPAWFYHTITAIGDAPANYLMFKWYNRQSESNGVSEGRLSYGKYAVSDFIPTENAPRPLRTQLVFQGSTDCLAHLQCHTSTLQPDAGYPLHTDAHDVAIVVMKGEIESLGIRSRPNSVLFFAAGQPHDMHNPTSETAEYLVFEFHGNHPLPIKRIRKSLWDKMRDPKSWRGKALELKARFGIK
jgi:mannose-6-phosphate isomerase-like protein (cupin superfamily)